MTVLCFMLEPFRIRFMNQSYSTTKVIYFPNLADIKRPFNTTQALKLARELGQLNLVQDCLESLADQFAASGNHRKAYEYHLEFSALKDSLINDERISALSEMETKYEVEKKELQLARLETEKLLSKVENKDVHIHYCLNCGDDYHCNSGIHQQRINKLEQKRQSLESIAKTEKQERERIAKDMHDELGSGISRITWITATAQRQHPVTQGSHLFIR